jgi:hypothetical protein
LLRKANCGTERGQPKRVVSYAVPMVRIHLPPAESPLRTGHPLKGRPDSPIVRDGAGERCILFRPRGQFRVDQTGIVLDVLVQRRRDKQPAKRLLRKLLKKQMRPPRVMITDKLASYCAAKRDVASATAASSISIGVRFFRIGLRFGGLLHGWRATPEIGERRIRLPPPASPFSPVPSRTTGSELLASTPASN